MKIAPVTIAVLLLLSQVCFVVSTTVRSKNKWRALNDIGFTVKCYTSGFGR